MSFLFWDNGDGGDGTGDAGDPGANAVGSALGQATGDQGQATSSTTVGGVTAVGDTTGVGEATSTNPNALGFNVAPGQGQGSAGPSVGSVANANSQGQAQSTAQAPGDEGAAAAGTAVANALAGAPASSVGGGTGATLGQNNAQNQFHGNSTLGTVAATNLGHELAQYAQAIADPAVTKLVNRINALNPHTSVQEVHQMINDTPTTPQIIAQLNAALHGQALSAKGTAPALGGGPGNSSESPTGQVATQNPTLAAQQQAQLAQQLASQQDPPSGQFGYGGVGQATGLGPGTSAPTNSNAENIATNALFGTPSVGVGVAPTNALGAPQHAAPALAYGTNSSGQASVGTDSHGQPSAGTDSHGQSVATNQAQDHANALGATRAPISKA